MKTIINKIAVSLGLLLLCEFTYSQQLPLYSQYMMNSFLLNPAIAGSVDYLPVILTVRRQWVGIDEGPSTQALSANYLFEYYNFGVGGYLFNDKFGAMQRTGIQLCGAYHITLSSINSKLSFGLALKAFQFKFDETKFKPIDDADPKLTYGTINKFIPDADFGAYIYNYNYYVGLSANQLIEFKINFGDSSVDKNAIIRHYYLIGGYKYNINDNFEIEPSVLLKGTFKVPWQIDFNIKAYYQKNYWLGLSYRTSKDLIVMFGIKYIRYYIGYAFDYSLSTLRKYTNGSHEFMLGINVTEGKKKGSKLL
jgi:type IX secretion system PorP/SprF family membrane protein